MQSGSKSRILPSLSELTEDQRKLAAQWMPLAQSEAAKLGKTRTQRQDLLAEFELALLRCAVRYDPSRGYTFRALLTRAFANAAISLHRKTKRKAEIPLLAHDAENAIEPPPARKTQPAPEEPPARPPTARDLARAGVGRGQAEGLGRGLPVHHQLAGLDAAGELLHLAQHAVRHAG
jgi:DNA-directed RNA polymerase specialized sigma subunit